MWEGRETAGRGREGKRRKGINIREGLREDRRREGRRDGEALLM